MRTERLLTFCLRMIEYESYSVPLTRNDIPIGMSVWFSCQIRVDSSEVTGDPRKLGSSVVLLPITLLDQMVGQALTSRKVDVTDIAASILVILQKLDVDQLLSLEEADHVLLHLLC